MSNYELTISANDNTVVSLKINNRKSIFFGSKKFILKPSSDIELSEVSKKNNFKVLSNHFTSHPNKFKMPENNLKLYVDSENNQSGYKYSNYFLLKELGSSSVMLKSYFNPHSVIEKLGKNKVRIYISEKLEAGKLNFSSPAYFVTNRTFASYTQYRGVQIAYNTEYDKRNVNQTAFFEKSFDIKSSYIDNGHLILVTSDILPMVKKEINVYIQKTNLVVLNGMQTLEVLSPNLLRVKDEKIAEMYTKINSNILGSFYFIGGTKIYCDVSNLRMGDVVVFDYETGKGKSFGISNILKDEQGFYLLIDEFIENKPKYICKSHTQNNTTDVVNFSYENKTAYYSVSETDITTELLWLTHKPDAVRGGRANSVLSYVDCYFEYEELDNLMKSSYEDSNV
tara:strand:- start:1286 stop:2473 length:1188 start_codon:yes stop_codon:yes gene_type:complete